MVATARERSRYLLKLEQFLGTQNVERRIKAVGHALQSEPGPIYKQFWLYPQVAWWLGLRDARQLRAQGKAFHAPGRVTPRIDLCLETAVQIAYLYSTMPQRTRQDFQRRLLAKDPLRPVLTELHTAAHFWQMSYDITWIDPSGTSHKRSPEFLASREGTVIEVECKSQTVDAGRMVGSPHFYRLADRIAKACMAATFMGDISITVPERLPVSAAWSQELMASVQAHLHEGEGQFALSDTTAVTLNLQRHDNRELSRDHVQQHAQRLHGGSSSLAFLSSRPQDAWMNMVYIRLISQRPDHILKHIFDDIRDARRQLSGDHAALITCFIPEIDSFESLREPSSNLSAMTHTFFEKHGKDFVYAVSYFSDGHLDGIDSEGCVTGSPAIIYRNPYYDTKYGEGFPLLNTDLSDRTNS
jgi:hypothetical protein